MKTSTVAALAAPFVSATFAEAQSQSVSELIAAIKNPDDKVRGPAWQAAAPIGAPAVKPLAALISDPNFEAARAAKRALWKIVRHAGRPGADSERKAVVSELVRLLEDQPVPVRREALWMLSEIGGAEVVQPVAKLLADQETREDARAALQRIPGDESIQALQVALQTAPEEYPIPPSPYRFALGVSTSPGIPAGSLFRRDRLPVPPLLPPNPHAARPMSSEPPITGPVSAQSKAPIPTRGYRVSWIPICAAAFGLVIVLLWMRCNSSAPLTARIPGTDRGPDGDAGPKSNPVLAGKLVKGEGTSANLAGAWPGFRGPTREGWAQTTANLSRSWDAAGPRQLWSTDLGEGYAGAAVAEGRVYVVDYDREQKQDSIRCLSLADGKEIWRFIYPVAVKRNHGMSRTVPTVTDKLVVAMGPKCHVACLDCKTGELRWGLDLVRQFGATVPPWYAGQCPLVDQGSVILAPGGKDALIIAVDSESGKVLWRTPNPHGWKMTHSSIAAMELGGERSYVYCASGGVLGVSAKDGRVLWETTDWKISIATVPSPTILNEGRIFLSGGYNAGSMMLQVQPVESRFTAKALFKLDPEVFGATQQTPIYYEQHLYGVRPDGRLVCLNTDGKVVWTSGPSQVFGLGSYLLANGLIYVLNDNGNLSLVEASPEKYSRLAQAQVLKGRESWAPMALAGDRLIARDFTRLVCLQL